MSRNLPYSSYALPIPGPGVNVSEPGVPLLYVPVPPLNPKPKPFPVPCAPPPTGIPLSPEAGPLPPAASAFLVCSKLSSSGNFFSLKSILGIVILPKTLSPVLGGTISATFGASSVSYSYLYCPVLGSTFNTNL